MAMALIAKCFLHHQRMWYGWADHGGAESTENFLATFEMSGNWLQFGKEHGCYENPWPLACLMIFDGVFSGFVQDCNKSSRRATPFHKFAVAEQEGPIEFSMFRWFQRRVEFPSMTEMLWNGCVSILGGKKYTKRLGELIPSLVHEMVEFW